MVDSELATSTKTSASKQNLSIQLSSSDVTSVPGLQSEKSVGYYYFIKFHIMFHSLLLIRSGNLESDFHLCKQKLEMKQVFQ